MKTRGTGTAMPESGILIWETAGIFFIIIAGSLFHFVYPWTGEAAAAGVFFPVNESVWEHLKLAFWPVLVYAAVEYPFIGYGRPGFIAAKAGGILAFQLFIPGFYYGYHLFTGRNIFFLDISSFILGAALCQTAGVIILRRVSPSGLLSAVAIGFLAIYGALLVLFTFSPPKVPLFLDGTTKTYGLQRKL